MSDATRDRLGLDGWPDGPFGVTALGGARTTSTSRRRSAAASPRARSAT
ncbi:unnamed protein product [[Actinomadura] parvosata subsp. kistnae]|nr:unnamed protein product [Actinomadura parvosata subsp. kistnae]